VEADGQIRNNFVDPAVNHMGDNAADYIFDDAGLLIVPNQRFQRHPQVDEPDLRIDRSVRDRVLFQCGKDPFRQPSQNALALHACRLLSGITLRLKHPIRLNAHLKEMLPAIRFHIDERQ
jgi:hypothetical protein